VVYVVENNGDKDVYIGGKNLSNSKKTDFMPSFTADGSKILFLCPALVSTLVPAPQVQVYE
ncbi:MAG: hypothetical protein B6I38_04090, partial [Anaerolineaceae bacterium 4572_5.1]